MSEPEKEKDSIINAHTHVFISRYVPPFIARTFLPWPLYYLIHLPTVLWIFKSILNFKNKQRYETNSISNRFLRFKTKFNILLRDNLIVRLIWMLASLWLTMQAVFFIYAWLKRIFNPDTEGMVLSIVEQAKVFLKQYNLLLNTSIYVQILLVLLVVLFIKSGRNLILFLTKNVATFLKKLPGKHTQGMIERYILMGRFAIYKKQNGIKNKLTAQYDPGSGFVLLPMDMKYMGAGNLNTGLYKEQHDDLAKMKEGDKTNKLFPFVAVDPRRIEDKNAKDFFEYDVSGNTVVLEKDCLVKRYIEDKKFSGFKLYPALGYYPFDEALLPLWKYAADNEIPIMTHCIKGVIYYRGKKQKAWDQHPVFKTGDGQMPLREKKNVDFQLNFTHPLNYLCLLHEPLLRVLVGNAKDPRVKKLFGYNGPDKAMDKNLKNLKVCLAHFGGEPEWEKYLEMDRNPRAQQLIRDRDEGLNLHLDDKTPHWTVYEQIWRGVDWYSLITSLMLQFPNVYADISFMISKPQIYPLLRETLSTELNENLRKKVLFGTDFYVVRNLKSDKGIITETRFGLDEEDFDMIARTNPRAYLSRKFPKKPSTEHMVEHENAAGAE